MGTAPTLITAGRSPRVVPDRYAGIPMPRDTPEKRFGMVSRTYAQWALDKHGLWPPPGAKTDFDRIALNLASYIDIQLLTDSGKWKTYKGFAGEPPMNPLDVELFYPDAKRK